MPGKPTKKYTHTRETTLHERVGIKVGRGGEGPAARREQKFVFPHFKKEEHEAVIELFKDAE